MIDKPTDALRQALAKVDWVDAQLPSLRAFIQSYPGFAWIKRFDPETGRFIALVFSREYTLKMFGNIDQGYVGKTDFDFWPPQTAQVWHANDVATLEQRGSVIERAPFKSPVTGFEGVFVGHKWCDVHDGVQYVKGLGQVET